MWDFEHEPSKSSLATRYSLEWMMPSACAARLTLPTDDPNAADIGLVPIATLATTPGLRILPGCAIASTRRVRSLLLIHRASQPLNGIRTIAADTSSRATLAYTQILFRRWWNPAAPPEFLQHRPDLDAMLETADAAMLIGDPALYALQERQNREERNGEQLVYLDLAEEWIKLTGTPWISAIWAIRESSIESSGLTLETIAADFLTSKNHGQTHIEQLVQEWSAKLPLPENTIREYLTTNIHYDLDQECLKGLNTFFTLAAETGVLPKFSPFYPNDRRPDELSS